MDQSTQTPAPPPPAREPTGQHQVLSRDLVSELEVAARHGRTAWRVALGVGSALVTVAGVLFLLAKNSFEAGREAQRYAGAVVTREEARQMVREAVEPLERQVGDLSVRCAGTSTCCAGIVTLARWLDWEAACLDTVADRARVRCANRPQLTLTLPFLTDKKDTP